jgi:hypothetical protein
MAYSPPKPRRWFDHPAINVASLTVAVISLTLYLTSQRVRQLEFYVSPDRAVVVKSGFSDLHVLYQNQEIKDDVTAAQVTVWNAGYEPITTDAVLSTVAIVTEPKVKILSASIRRVSRDVITFHADQKLLPTSIVPLSWKILEHGDGAVVQIIYLGDPRVKLKVIGTIEGQSQIRGFDPGGTIKSPSEQRKRAKYAQYASILAGIVGIFAAVPLILRRWRDGRDWETVIPLATASIIFVSAVAIGIYGLLSQPSLPFSS